MRRVSFSLLAIFVFLSCSVLESDTGNALQAFETWNEKKPNSYEYTYDRNCFCMFNDPVVIIVADDKVVNILDVETREPYATVIDEEEGRELAEKYPDIFITIDRVFSDLISYLESNPYSVQEEYNPEFGYPAEIYIDFNKNTADEEVSFNIYNFRNLDQ